MGFIGCYTADVYCDMCGESDSFADVGIESGGAARNIARNRGWFVETGWSSKLGSRTLSRPHEGNGLALCPEHNNFENREILRDEAKATAREARNQSASLPTAAGREP